MKYRTRKEIQLLTMSQVLDELETLKIATKGSFEPEACRVFPSDVMVNGVMSASGPGPAYLTDAQQAECHLLGSVEITFQQQVEQGTSLDRWKSQLYDEGKATWIKSLGKTKLLAELKKRQAEPTLWEARTFNRLQLDKKLWFAMANDTEEACDR
jgi:hypothetical protein